MNYSIKGDLSSKEIGGELFIYNRKNSTIYSFNGTGVFIWGMINKAWPLTKSATVCAKNTMFYRPRPPKMFLTL